MRRVMQVLILKKIDNRDQKSEKKNTREGRRSPVFPGLIIARPRSGIKCELASKKLLPLGREMGLMSASATAYVEGMTGRLGRRAVQLRYLSTALGFSFSRESGS